MKVILLYSLLYCMVWAELSCDCGKRNSGRIVGGNEARKNEYPWIVALQKNLNNFTFCGGAIITQRHVITAAHCVKKSKAEEISIIVGAHDLSNLSERTSQRHYIELSIIHPLYHHIRKINDIAILVTANTIEYNQFVGPVCMPTRLLGNETTGQMVKAIGWGEYGPESNPDRIKKLREVDLQLVTSIYCKRRNASLLCTYVKGKDTCSGDSGGPVTWLDPDNNRFTLVGIVSYGFDTCGNSTRPGVNTNVSAYLDWIDQQIMPLENEAKICHEI